MIETHTHQFSNFDTSSVFGLPKSNAGESCRFTCDCGTYVTYTEGKPTVYDTDNNVVEPDSD